MVCFIEIYCDTPLSNAQITISLSCYRPLFVRPTAFKAQVYVPHDGVFGGKERHHHFLISFQSAYRSRLRQF